MTGRPRKGLTVEGLSVSYGGADAVRAVDLTVAPGERVVVLGANGAGKTSLLRAILGLAPATGRIALDGRALDGLRPEARARAGLGCVPEGRRVFAGMSVADNLAVASRAGRAARAARMNEAFALFPQLAGRRGEAAWRLSGGQQQMLAIARAMMADPRLFLLDEPGLGLAPAVLDDVAMAVDALAGRGAGFLIAEQNLALARRLADRVLVMRRGTIVFAGTPGELDARPEALSLR